MRCLKLVAILVGVNVLQMPLAAAETSDQTDTAKCVTGANHTNLWAPAVSVPDRGAIREPKNVQLITVKPLQTGVDGYRFHHGAAIIAYKDELFVSIGVNKGVENTSGEEAIVLRSRDDGRTWGEPRVMQTPRPGTGISHGDFLIHQDKLWAFHGAFAAIETLPTLNTDAKDEFNDVFPGLCTGAYILDEGSNRWDPQGVVCENFWPCVEPVRLANGNWFCTGMNKDFLAAVAVSDGDNLKKWRSIDIPMEGDMRANETSFWADGSCITAVIRNHRPADPEKPCAAVSFSADYGETWTPARESNLPLSIAKPYCGVLSTGRRYLIGNSVNETNASRKYLTLALSRPGEEQLSTLYLVRDVQQSPSPAGDARMNHICYPHAIEYKGFLYVVHSAGHGHNINNIDLAIVPLRELER